jgi:hypothetical protein
LAVGIGGGHADGGLALAGGGGHGRLKGDIGRSQAGGRSRLAVDADGGNGGPAGQWRQFRKMIGRYGPFSINKYVRPIYGLPICFSSPRPAFKSSKFVA